jgi:hypothetical protein
MKFKDFINRTTIRWIVITIVLGAIGSGLWERLLKPSLFRCCDYRLFQSGSAAAPAQTLHPRLAQRHGLGGPEGARLEAPFEPQAVQQRGESHGGEAQVGPRGARTASRAAQKHLLIMPHRIVRAHRLEGAESQLWCSPRA